jgi:hypothetical protein
VIPPQARIAAGQRQTGTARASASRPVGRHVRCSDGSHPYGFATPRANAHGGIPERVALERNLLNIKETQECDAHPLILGVLWGVLTGFWAVGLLANIPLGLGTGTLIGALYYLSWREGGFGPRLRQRPGKPTHRHPKSSKGAKEPQREKTNVHPGDTPPPGV